MPQEHIIDTERNQPDRRTLPDPFYDLGTTKENIDQRIKDHENRIQALE